MAKYGYTIGGGLIGALAGAALTKLTENENDKATLKDYLINSGVGLGLGALGGGVIDSVTNDTKTVPVDEAATAIDKHKDAKQKAESRARLYVGSGATGISFGGTEILHRLGKRHNKYVDALQARYETVQDNLKQLETGLDKAKATVRDIDKASKEALNLGNTLKSELADARKSYIADQKLLYGRDGKLKQGMTVHDANAAKAKYNASVFAANNKYNEAMAKLQPGGKPLSPDDLTAARKAVADLTDAANNQRRILQDIGTPGTKRLFGSKSFRIGGHTLTGGLALYTLVNAIIDNIKSR